MHKYLQKNYSDQQQLLVQPLNSIPKRGHPLNESGGSTNNGNGRCPQPRRGAQKSSPNYVQHQQEMER